MLPNFVKQENLSRVTHWSQSLRKLHSGRIDILILTEADLLPVLKTDTYKNWGIRKVGVMEKINAYPYFHKKHRDLVPRFEEVLKAMTEEGLIERYRKIAFGE